MKVYSGDPHGEHVAVCEMLATSSFAESEMNARLVRRAPQILAELCSLLRQAQNCDGTSQMDLERAESLAREFGAA